jgi:hypothetical protein
LDKELWPRSKGWILEIDHNYNTNGLEGAGRGGICTLPHENLALLVADHGTIFQNRAIWLKLSGLPMGDLGILNLYAPNDP